MALNFVQLAYDVAKDQWDLPDINYLKSLDGSEMSKKVLEDVAKEAAQKLLSHFATVASNKLLEILLQRLETLTLPDCSGKSQVIEFLFKRWGCLRNCFIGMLNLFKIYCDVSEFMCCILFVFMKTYCIEF